MKLEGMFTITQALAAARQAQQDFRNKHVSLTPVVRHETLCSVECLYHVYVEDEKSAVGGRIHLDLLVLPVRSDSELMAEQRQSFEDAVMTLQRTLKVFGWPDAASSDDPALSFHRNTDGTYVVQQWNAAWWGWCAARGL